MLVLRSEGDTCLETALKLCRCEMLKSPCNSSSFQGRVSGYSFTLPGVPGAGSLALIIIIFDMLLINL